MNILLFIVYTLTIIGLLKVLPFFKNSTISFKWLSIIFLVKVMAGFVYAYVHQNYYVSADAFSYVEKGAILQSYFQQDIALFFKLCFGPNGFAATESLKPFVKPLGYWTDTSAYTLVRINALLSFVGFGNYYLHLIFWQFFGLCGLTALYKAFIHFFKEKRMLLLVSIFFVPSVVFWYSGIHKEAISILAIGFVTLFVVRWAGQKLSISLVIVTLISIVLLALIRLYLLVIIVPAAVALYFSLKYEKKFYINYLIIYSLCIVFLLIAIFIKPNLNPINEFIKTQQYFEIVGAGNAEIKTPKLEPTIWSLIKHSPKAFFSTLLKPSLLDVSTNNLILKIVAGLETLFILILIVTSTVKGKWLKYYNHPIVAYVLCIVIFYYVLLGLTIPNLGALCRYKSMVLPLLIPVLCIVLDGVFFRKRFF